MLWMFNQFNEFFLNLFKTGFISLFQFFHYLFKFFTKFNFIYHIF